VLRHLAQKAVRSEDKILASAQQHIFQCATLKQVTEDSAVALLGTRTIHAEFCLAPISLNSHGERNNNRNISFPLEGRGSQATPAAVS